MDTLQFYAFSSDKNAGYGTGDIVKDASIYQELNKIKNWRQMFSSRWIGNPFKYNGFTYLSYEHAYQAAKYKINGYDEIAHKFCLESNNTLSLIDEAHKHNKDIIFTKKEIKNWDENIDKIKDELYHAKFTHLSWPGRALMLTQNAILINAGPRIRKIECTRLMKIRKELLS